MATGLIQTAMDSGVHYASGAVVASYTKDQERESTWLAALILYRAGVEDPGESRAAALGCAMSASAGAIRPGEKSAITNPATTATRPARPAPTEIARIIPCLETAYHPPPRTNQTPTIDTTSPPTFRAAPTTTITFAPCTPANPGDANTMLQNRAFSAITG